MDERKCTNLDKEQGILLSDRCARLSQGESTDLCEFPLPTKYCSLGHDSEPASVTPFKHPGCCPVPHLAALEPAEEHPSYSTVDSHSVPTETLTTPPPWQSHGLPESASDYWLWTPLESLLSKADQLSLARLFQCHGTLLLRKQHPQPSGVCPAPLHAASQLGVIAH